MAIIDKKLSLRNRNTLLLGVYEDEDKMVAATSELVHAGIPVHDVFTPYPVHGLDRIIGARRSWLSIAAFLCGLTGFILAYSMIYYMYVYDWPLNIGNKPERLTPAWVPVLFEGTVLFTAFGMSFFFFWRSRMVHGIQPELLDIRQTDDLMIICVESQEGVDSGKAIDIMRKNGANELRQRTGGVQTVI